MEQREKMSKQKQDSRVAVLVTTAHRGVFFGFAEPGDLDKKSIRVTRARLCIYWSADVKGFMGLAATGPTAGCKIGPEVPAITLQDVTSASEVAASAVAAWEKAPWAR